MVTIYTATCDVKSSAWCPQRLFVFSESTLQDFCELETSTVTLSVKEGLEGERRVIEKLIVDEG